MVRPEPRKECDMAKIGTFKKVSGEFRGQITTLSVQAKSVRIAPEKRSERQCSQPPRFYR